MLGRQRLARVVAERDPLALGCYQFSWHGDYPLGTGTRVPLQLAPGEPLVLHLFLDRSVLEVFIDGGRECVTRVVDPLPEDLAVEVFAHRGRAVVESLRLWRLRSIW